MERLIEKMVTPSGFGAPLPSPSINSQMTNTIESAASALDSSMSVGKLAGSMGSLVSGRPLEAAFKAFPAVVGLIDNHGLDFGREVASGIKNLLTGEGSLSDVMGPIKAEFTSVKEALLTPEAPSLSKPLVPEAPGMSSMRPH